MRPPSRAVHRLRSFWIQHARDDLLSAHSLDLERCVSRRVPPRPPIGTLIAMIFSIESS
jgi:hypothetical protein